MLGANARKSEVFACPAAAMYTSANITSTSADSISMMRTATASCLFIHATMYRISRNPASDGTRAAITTKEKILPV